MSGDFNIRFADKLDSLQDLSSLRHVGGDFRVEGNLSLPQAGAFARRVQVGGETFIVRNGPVQAP